MGSTPRLLLDPTADEERAAEGDGEEEPEEDGSRSGSSSSRKRRAGAKSRGRGRRALGLLHLALMPASGEVTQVKGRGGTPKKVYWLVGYIIYGCCCRAPKCTGEAGGRVRGEGGDGGDHGAGHGRVRLVEGMDTRPRHSFIH